MADLCPCDLSLVWVSPGAEGGLDAAVDMPSASVDVPSVSVDLPSASVDVPSGSVDIPSVDLSGKAPDMPSVGGEVSGELPSVDAKLTAPDVDVKGGDVSLGAGLAAGLTAAVGATAVGLGLSGKADKPEGEVRACVRVFIGLVHCCVGDPDTGDRMATLKGLFSVVLCTVYL